jgi:hypothetical protein
MKKIKPVEEWVVPPRGEIARMGYRDKVANELEDCLEAVAENWNTNSGSITALNQTKKKLVDQAMHNLGYMFADIIRNNRHSSINSYEMLVHLLMTINNIAGDIKSVSTRVRLSLKIIDRAIKIQELKLKREDKVIAKELEQLKEQVNQLCQVNDK